MTEIKDKDIEFLKSFKDVIKESDFELQKIELDEVHISGNDYRDEMIIKLLRKKE